MNRNKNDAALILQYLFKPPRSEERVQGTKFLAGVWGLKPCARCAGFSMAKIGNRKERLRVREAGASAAGRGQRPYASFPDRSPKQVWAAAQGNPRNPKIAKRFKRSKNQEAKRSLIPLPLLKAAAKQRGESEG